MNNSILKNLEFKFEMTIFLLFNLFVLFDFAGIDMYDTCLVEVGNKTAYCGDVPFVSQGIILSIILIGGLIVIISFLMKKGLIGLGIINVFYSVLLLIFYKNEIMYYLPLDIITDRLVEFVQMVFNFIYLSYLAIIINLILLIKFIKRYISKKRGIH